jgi:hypothetical protein
MYLQVNYKIYSIHMRLKIATATFVSIALPVLSFDLTDKSYIGLAMSEIKSTFSCAPSFLILGGGHRLICNDNNNGNSSLVFVLRKKTVVSVDITPQNPPLIFNQTISSLQSQCEAGEDNVTFKCKNGIQATVRDLGFGLSINLCLQGHC